MTCAEAAQRFGSEFAKDLSGYAEHDMITIGFIEWHS